jgi:ABC-type proline/glycine betaine transport system substrate-binding protein
MNMFKKALAVLMVLAVVVAFSLPAFAKDTVRGKVEALDKDAKKVTISGTEYSLSDGAAQNEVAVGEEVEAIVEDGTIQTLTKI